jgi:integrase
MLGLLLGCGLRRSEVVGLNLDQLQSREGHWVIVNLVGKGARLRTVPVPSLCKELVDAWRRHSGVSDEKEFRRVLKGGMIQPAGVTANVVWYAVRRCAGRACINDLAPHDLRRTCARLCHGCGGELEQIQFLLGHASVQTTERFMEASRSCKMRLMIDLEFQSHAKMPKTGCFFGLATGWTRSLHMCSRLPSPAYIAFPTYCA